VPYPRTSGRTSTPFPRNEPFPGFHPGRCPLRAGTSARPFRVPLSCLWVTVCRPSGDIDRSATGTRSAGGYIAHSHRSFSPVHQQAREVHPAVEAGRRLNTFPQLDQFGNLGLMTRPGEGGDVGSAGQLGTFTDCSPGRARPGGDRRQAGDHPDDRLGGGDLPQAGTRALPGWQGPGRSQDGTTVIQGVDTSRERARARRMDRRFTCGVFEVTFSTLRDAPIISLSRGCTRCG
jgi:hypothetical protein